MAWDRNALHVWQPRWRSVASSGSLVGDITDFVEVEVIGAALLILVRAIAEEPALSRIFRLWTRCMFLMPAEFRPPAKLGMPSRSHKCPSDHILGVLTDVTRGSEEVASGSCRGVEAVAPGTR